MEPASPTPEQRRRAGLAEAGTAKAETYNWRVVRRVVVFTFVAAFAAFCVVQDRVTAAGSTRYAEEAMAAMARHERVTPVDAVMRPAIRRSVRLGFAAAGAVLIAGFGIAAAVGRRERG